MAGGNPLLINVRSPITAGLEGLRQGRQVRQEITAQEALRELADNKRPTALDIKNAMLKAPKMAKAIQASYDNLNEESRRNELRSTEKVYLSLRNNDIDSARTFLESRKTAATNSGLDEEAKLADIQLRQLEMNPTQVKNMSEIGLRSILGKKFDERYGGRNYSVLSEKEKSSLGLDTDKPYQMSPDGKITQIGGGGVNVNVGDKGKFGPIPQGYYVEEDKDGLGWGMLPIKGSPAYKKNQDLKKKKVKENELAKKSGGVVFEDIGRLKSAIEDAPWYSPVTGVVAETILPSIRQNRVDAEQLKQTVVSNIGFDRLQQMREASPTGGALGQVSDRELSTLQVVLGSLSLDQSEDQIIKNLDRLNKMYGDILKKANAYPNAEEFGFGSSEESPPLATDSSIQSNTPVVLDSSGIQWEIILDENGNPIGKKRAR